MGIKNRKQVRVGTPQENQMIAIVKKAVSYHIDQTYITKKECAEAALNSFMENSGIDPFTFTTTDCVAHHVGTLEKIYKTGEKPASGKTKNIRTAIIEKVYPETYGKLPRQVTVEDVCDLERNDIPEDPEDASGQHNEMPAPGIKTIPTITSLPAADDVISSELSAQDKKELAMYAIDQHYFFLKQLTGVI